MKTLLTVILALSIMPAFAADTNQFVYITNYWYDGSTPAITLCSVKQSDGSFTNCQDSGFTIEDLTAPAQITFGYSHAYVTTVDGPVVQCEVSNKTGLLSDCVEAGDVEDTDIIGIELITSNNGPSFAYLADANAEGQLWQCPVDLGSGLFGTCATNSQNFTNGLSFATLQTFSNKYLYLPEGDFWEDEQPIWKCEVNLLTGAIPDTCADSGAGAIFDGPGSIEFITINDNTYAYITSYNDGTIILCSVDTEGNLSDCSPLSQTFFEPGQIALPVIQNTHYFYVTDTCGGDVVKCIIASDGTLNQCGNVLTNMSAPYGLTFFP